MRIVEQLLSDKGRDVWFVGPEATVHEAVRLMVQKNVGAVLVCADTQLLGILSERDCIRRVMHELRDPKQVRVDEVMTTDLTAVSPGDTVAHCMQVMTDERLRHLPVLEQGKMVGLVSIGDVVKAQLTDQEELISGLESYIHGVAVPASL